MLNKPISYITPFTLLDYPDKSACILWYAGCNMRCLYCYNPEIVLGKGEITFEEVVVFLKNRMGLLDGVVFSGGECLMHKNIISQIQQIKSMGFLIKIDTNGSNPKTLDYLINKNLVDYVALDFKSLDFNFRKITQTNLFSKFEISFNHLQKHKIPFEIRTTYHSTLFSINEINQMLHFLENKNYSGNYFIQAFKNNLETLTYLPHSLPIPEFQIIPPKSFSLSFR